MQTKIKYILINFILPITILILIFFLLNYHDFSDYKYGKYCKVIEVLDHNMVYVESESGHYFYTQLSDSSYIINKGDILALEYRNTGIFCNPD